MRNQTNPFISIRFSQLKEHKNKCMKDLVSAN